MKAHILLAENSPVTHCGIKRKASDEYGYTRTGEEMPLIHWIGRSPKKPLDKDDIRLNRTVCKACQRYYSLYYPTAFELPAIQYIWITYTTAPRLRFHVLNV